MNKIIISNVCKIYSKKVILNNVSFIVFDGVFGLLGKNGAGKTTLMRIMTGILKYSSGSISMNSINIEKSDDIRKIIGYLPQEFTFYPYFKVSEVLEYCAGLSQMKHSIIKSRIDEVLESVNLTDERNKRFYKLSGGMKRRLGIAQAILHNPDILILDEPTTGVDPEERYKIRELIRSLGEDKIVILSTHIIEDIEPVCKNIGVLHKGELQYYGDISGYKSIFNKESLEDAFLINIKGK